MLSVSRWCTLTCPRPVAFLLFTIFLNLVFYRHQNAQGFLLSFPCLTVHVLPFFSSTWLPPLLSFIFFSLPLLLPFNLSTFGLIQPRSREFSISPWPMKYANNINLPPSFMFILSITLPNISIPDVPFPAPLSTLVRSRFQVKPATLLIPIALFLVLLVEEFSVPITKVAPVL